VTIVYYHNRDHKQENTMTCRHCSSGFTYTIASILSYKTEQPLTMKRKIRKQELHPICSLEELWSASLLGEKAESVKALL